MKKLILFCTIFTLIFCCCGCGNSNVDLSKSTSNQQESDSSVSNPFETNQDTEILGSLSHSPTEIKTDKNSNVLPFEYTGGEFELKYEVVAEGKAKNLGFLIFVDGVAQAYKTDSKSEYKYMHYLELKKDNEPVNLTFKFTPITGKKGETVPFNIVSIYNAQFMPDMKKTSAYGGYHMELGSMLKLHFNSDAPSIEASKYSQKQIISTLDERKDNITENFLKNELSNVLRNITNEELNTKVFDLTYYNGKKVFDNIAYSRDKPFKIKYCLVGAPGIEYKTTFYINHQPISKDDIISYKTTIEKGMLHIIEFEIYTSKLDDLNTFYAMSVPTNYEDYPKVNAYISKTPSILLYKGK